MSYPYIERDGDWVLRPPGRLRDVTMMIFGLGARRDALAALCRATVDEPTNGRVTATPLLSGVLLSCVDIRRGYSDHEEDRHRGFGTERDVAFFVPVVLCKRNVPFGYGTLVPYIYVDDAPAVLIGREIFGLPKQLSQIRFASSPPDVEAVSDVAVARDSTQQIQHLPVVRVSTSGPEHAQSLAGDWATVGPQLVGAFVRALDGEAALLNVGLLDVPMVLLKQFRHAEIENAAHHRTLVRVRASIDVGEFRGAELLCEPGEGAVRGSRVRVECPAYHVPRIAHMLGIAVDQEARIGVRLRLGFSIPLGEVLWP